MKDIKNHWDKLQEVALMPKYYNPESNRILRLGLWNIFQSTYLRLNGISYDSKEQHTKNNIGVLLSYFTNSEKFLDSPALRNDFNDPSLEKGMLIMGGYGNGKTSCLVALNDIMNRHLYGNRFKMVNSQDLVKEYECLNGAEDKKEFWQKYMTPILCIDDAKKERRASNYGVSEIVGDLLVMRYNKRLKTHLTCNYVEGDEEQSIRKGLEEFSRYGEHFYDRLFEMFNIVEFKGKSKRK